MKMRLKIKATLYKYVNLRKENQNNNLNHDRNR